MHPATDMNEPTDDTRPEVPVVADDLDELSVGLLASAVGFDKDRQRLSDTDGVRELDKGTTSETSSYKGLGDPASGVGSRTIHLGEVLAREGTSTVGTPATVGVNDDLTASETSITLGTTDNETSRGLDLANTTVNISFSRQ